MWVSFAASRTYRGGGAVFEFRKVPERVPSGTWQLDTVTYLQAPARHSHKVGPDSKESTDFQHRKRIAIGTDHNVVDRSHCFALLVLDVTPDQLGGPVPSGDGINVGPRDFCGLRKQSRRCCHRTYCSRDRDHRRHSRPAFGRRRPRGRVMIE